MMGVAMIVRAQDNGTMNKPKIPSVGQMRHELFVKGGEVLPHHQREANKAKFLETSAMKDRVYHGTTKDFTAFKKGRNWFSTDPEYANIYGGELTENHGENGRVMPLHVQAKNPKIFHASQKGMMEWTKPEHHDQHLKRKGHDSVLFVDDNGKVSTGYAFDPKQIKSAIGNRGTYDINDPDITKAKGGEVHMSEGGKPNDAAFIGYLSPHGKFESYPESVAKANDYHHSYTIKDLDAYNAEGGLTFVRMNSDPEITIKGTPAMDPFHHKNSPMVSDLARRIIKSGGHHDMPIKVEHMGFEKHEAPYQGKYIGTLRQWSMRNAEKKAKGGNVMPKYPSIDSSGGITHLANGGNVLHNQGAHMKPTLAQMRLRLADGGSSTVTQPTGTPSATNVQPTQDQSDIAKNLKSMYGIDNPALLSYITSNNGLISGTNTALSGSDLKNLSTAFNAKTPQEINDMQTSGSQPLNYQAQLELQNQAGDIQRKKDLANPHSWIYAKGLSDPTKDPKRQSMNLTQYNQDNQYSSLFDPNNTSPSASLNAINDMYKNQLNTTFDPFGNRHIETTQGTYTFDKTGKPLGFNLLSSDPRSQVQQQAFGNANKLATADNYDQFGMPLAEGGTVNQRPILNRYAYGGPIKSYATGNVVNATPQLAFSSDPEINKAWLALSGQNGDAITAQRQALAQQNEAYQTNQNIQSMFNQDQTGPQSYSLDPSDIAKSSTNSGQTSSTNYSNPPPEIYSVNQGQTGSTNFLNPPPTQSYRFDPSQTGSIDYSTPPSLSKVNTNGGFGNDMLYGPQGDYTSSGTPLIVGGANQITSPLASMSAMQQPQAMASAAPVANMSTVDSAALKNYGITNPALISYITSTPGLTDSDLKNLGTAFNSKTAQQISEMQRADDPLHVIANAIVSHDATVKERLSDPKSYVYAKGNVPVYRPASQSTNGVGDVFTTKNSGILSQENDQNGYRHITSGGNEYLINPNSNRILGITPITHDGGLMPYGQGPNPYGGALAKGGSVSEGGVNQRPMSEPNLAQMRLEMGRHKNPQVMSNIGVDEAVDIDPKIFVNPNPHSSGLPDIGGVKTPDGALPVGGIDMNPQQAGQQMMPQQPQQGQPQGMQQGQPNGAPPSMAPAGMGAPQGPSNILSLTPQGQAMNAMRPPQGPMAQKMAKGGQPTIAQMKNELHHFAQGGSEKDDGSSTRIHVPARGPKGVKGIKVPRHMWEGKVYGGVGPKKGQKVEGMKDINEARAEVYGSEHRQPLNIGQIGKAHRETLNEHFAKPLEEQTAAEKEALEKLRKAKHIGQKANTLDESEKLDTVRHETDDEGRTHVGYASKGVAGHALYTSGHGKDAEHHILNTCPGQTEGCGGGMDENGVVDTSKGTCFAPNAESQYVNAAVRRASHAQAKHDPAMTRDWILAHTGSLREAANQADKKNQRLLFRPNVVDETDTSSRHVLRHLNEQRKKDDKPPIIANSYAKTNELHDPENGYHVTHSNVGPKTKHGKEVFKNIGRDKARVRNTVLAHDNKGHFTNEQGNKTPPKNSYMVTNVKRGSPFDKEMQNTITHAKYWSEGRPLNELNEMEKDEGEEGHYNAKGQRTTPDKSHYGHAVVNGNRYDYQKQHILHPRLVQVGTNKDGTPHMIPTDSRFLDNKELDKTIPREKQFKTRNGKRAGLILMTTPTESTPNHLHHSSFTHDVNPTHIEYAKKNNGEYEIDPPLAQEFSKGKEYVAPQPIKIMRKAKGGQVIGHKMEYNDDFNAFPEQDFLSQHHLAARRANKV